MGLEEALPGSLSSSIRCRVDAVVSEDGADGGIRDLVAKVCQCSLDAVVSPSRIFPGHEEHEIDDLLRDSRTPHVLTPLAVIPLGGNQFSMPAQDRIGRHHGGDFL